MYVYEGFYTRNIDEESRILNKIETNYPKNFESIYWIFNFYIKNLKYKTYFTLYSQRLNNNEFSLLNETITFSSYDDKDNQVGFISASNLYKDEGQGDISSTGSSIYSVNSKRGIFNCINFIKIIFLQDLTRKVFFYKTI